MRPTPFQTVTGPAAAMAEENIDTDVIFPARFLLLTTRQGLGAHAFCDRHYAADGTEVPGYVLNTPPFRNPPVIVAGANFGSGSSREQAVWALHDLGVRAVIAPALGEIFHANCLRCGIVPIILPADVVATLLAAAREARCFTVDLEQQTVSVEGMAAIGFAIAPERRLALLNGWDETDGVLGRFSADIARFEAAQRLVQPWLYLEDGAQ